MKAAFQLSTLFILISITFFSGCMPSYQAGYHAAQTGTQKQTRKTSANRKSNAPSDELASQKDQHEKFAAALESYNQGKITECLKQLSPLVAKGDPKAVFLKGTCYLTYTPFRNEQKANEYYRDSIQGLKWMEKNGDLDAAYLLGLYDLHVGKTISGKKRMSKVFPEIRKKASKGSGLNQLRLANMYYQGWGTKQNKRLAFFWFQLSATKGYPHADYRLGLYYLKNGGAGIVKPNLTKAKSHFRKASAKNFALAQTELGWQLIHSKSASERQLGMLYLKSAKLRNEPTGTRIYNDLLQKKRTVSTSNTRKTSNTASRNRRARKVPTTTAERKAFTKTVSRAVGNSLMKSIGGGQDLVVTVRSYDFDSVLGTCEIDVLVSFNGQVFRADNYRVAGRITVNLDGTNARFARTAANKNYLEWEGFVQLMVVAEAVAKEVEKSNRRK